MAQAPHFGRIPTATTPFSVDDEKTLRSIDMTQADEIRLAERYRVIMANVQQIQGQTARNINEVLGVRNIEAGNLEHRYPNETLEDTLMRERIETKLYRHVENDLIAQHTRTSWYGKIGNHARNTFRAAMSLIGAKNVVERERDMRFGPDPAGFGNAITPRLQPSMEQRRIFVAERVFNNILIGLAVGDPIHAFVCATLILPPIASQADIQNALVNATAPQLYALRDQNFGVGIANPFTRDLAFADLITLVEFDITEKKKVTSMMVFDETRLHERFNGWFNAAAGSPEKRLADRILNVLVRDSIWPVAKHDEAKALLAFIESEVLERGAQEVLDEIDDIVGSEVPPMAEQSPDDLALSTAINQLTDSITKLRTDLSDAYAKAGILNNNFAHYEAIRTDPLTDGRTRSQAVSDQTKCIEQRNALFPTVVKNEKEYQSSFVKLFALIARIPGNLANPTPSLDSFRAGGANPVNTLALTTQPEFERLPAGARGNFFPTHMSLSDAAYQQALDEIKKEHLKRLVTKAKLTPFELLERLKRREYCRTNNLDPKYQHEEAARFAIKNAEDMVDDAGDNVELFRAGNRNISKIQARNIVFRTVERVLGKRGSWQHFKVALSKAQKAVGLEPIEIRTTTASDLFEEIVGSDIRFAPFRGITKYSTAVDIRRKILQSGDTVTPDTIEDFIQRIQEEIKSDRIAKFDWNLEDALVALKKLKNERWTRQYIEDIKARNAGALPREQVCVQFLASQREERAKVDRALRDMAQGPDAIHKRLLSKSKLKEIINSGSLKALESLQSAKIGSYELEAGKYEAQAKALPEGDPQRLVLERRAADERAKALAIKKTIDEQQTLHDRVQATLKEVKEQNLGYFATKRLFREKGLEQIYDKMGTNFRLARYWKNTKDAAKVMWGATAAAAVWTGERVLKTEHARKAFEIVRLAAKPITIPLGLAWKIGTFPFSLVGDAAMSTGRYSNMMARSVTDVTLINYLKEQPLELRERFIKCVERVNKLKTKQARANYSWTKKSYLKDILAEERKIRKIQRIYSGIRTLAVERKMESYLTPLVEGATPVAKEAPKPVLVKPATPKNQNAA